MWRLGQSQTVTALGPFRKSLLPKVLYDCKRLYSSINTVTGNEIVRRRPEHIAVLGAGLTGIALVTHLTKLLPNSKITIYESSNRVGGWVDSQVLDLKHHGTGGNVGGGSSHYTLVEHGPRVLRLPRISTTDASSLAFAKLLDILDEDRPGARAATLRHQDGVLGKYIYYPDHLVRMPINFNSRMDMLWTILRLAFRVGDPLVVNSFYDAITAVSKWWSMRKTKGANSIFAQVRSDPYWDISLGDAVEALLKPGAASRPGLLTALTAIQAGIYGADPYRLSGRQSSLSKPLFDLLSGPLAFSRGVTDYVSRRDFNFLDRHEQATMATGTLKICGSNLIFPAGSWAFFSHFWEMIVANPNVTIKLGTPVRRLESQSCKSTEVPKIKVITDSAEPDMYDKVLSTLFSRDLAKLAPSPHAPVKSALPSLANSDASTILVVNIICLGSEVKRIASQFAGFGYLIPLHKVSPEANPAQALGVIFDSQLNSVDEDSTTSNFTRFSVLLGGDHWRGLTHSQLLAMDNHEEATERALDTLERHMGIPARANLVASAHKLCVNCIPLHVVGHRRRMAQAHDELLAAFSGGVAVVGPSYTGPGLLESMRAALEAAEAVANPTMGHKKDDTGAFVSFGDTGLQHFVGAEEFMEMPLDTTTNVNNRRRKAIEEWADSSEGQKWRKKTQIPRSVLEAETRRALRAQTLR